MRVQKLGRKRAIDIQNEPQLQLTLDQLPDSAMYLKSFTGTTYDDNAWTALKQSDWDDQTDLVTLSETFLCYPQLYPVLVSELSRCHSNDPMLTSRTKMGTPLLCAVCFLSGAGKV